ncbi:circadian clock-controlled protein daywake-like [Anticarsia gemmatalis]|uniref:circadian clock-controlled protein daywake-like n=1 Tax=Anticarsia gemmatalis TaxID=129554 RepID=UPI003F764CDD
MFYFKFVFILFCSNYSFGLKKQPCGIDKECLINSVIDRVYPMFVAGMPGVETSDPLHLDAIVADLPTINYSLYNASMVGLKNCEFVKLNVSRETESTLFDYAIECPVLTVTSEYELNGIVDSVPVEGKGTCTMTYDDYYISISGKHVREEDSEGKFHVNIIDYTVKPVLRGGVKNPEYSGLIFSNDETCENRVKLIEKITRDTVMDVFMHKYIQNLKNFHNLVPIEDLHFKYVS